MQDQLVELMKKYRSIGLLKAGQLLLKPDDALRLADELEPLGIAVMGLDTWCYKEFEARTTLSQEQMQTLEIKPDVLIGPRAVQESITLVKRFITQSLPPNAVFVSLTLH